MEQITRHSLPSIRRWLKPPPELHARLRAQIAEAKPTRTPVRTRVRWALACIPLVALLTLIVRHLVQGPTSMV